MFGSSFNNPGGIQEPFTPTPTPTPETLLTPTEAIAPTTTTEMLPLSAAVDEPAAIEQVPSPKKIDAALAEKAQKLQELLQADIDGLNALREEDNRIFFGIATPEEYNAYYPSLHPHQADMAYSYRKEGYKSWYETRAKVRRNRMEAMEEMRGLAEGMKNFGILKEADLRQIVADYFTEATGIPAETFVKAFELGIMTMKYSLVDLHGELLSLKATKAGLSPVALPIWADVYIDFKDSRHIGSTVFRQIKARNIRSTQFHTNATDKTEFFICSDIDKIRQDLGRAVNGGHLGIGGLNRVAEQVVEEERRQEKIKTQQAEKEARFKNQTTIGDLRKALQQKLPALLRQLGNENYGARLMATERATILFRNSILKKYPAGNEWDTEIVLRVGTKEFSICKNAHLETSDNVAAGTIDMTWLDFDQESIVGNEGIDILTQLNNILDSMAHEPAINQALQGAVNGLPVTNS